MDFKILNWNIGGAKFLDEKDREKREKKRNEINFALKGLVETPLLAYQPDVITLQEIIQYKEPYNKNDSEDLPDMSNGPDDLIIPPAGYRYYPFPLIDSHILSSRAKWDKVKGNSDWHPNTYFAQGNAILLKEDTPNFPIWDLSNLCQNKNKDRHFIEKVHLDSGLYFGDRNTEPRAALVTHLIYDPRTEQEKNIEKRKPLDIFVINLHLTTLMMEREGVPEIDSDAERIRQLQLDIVINGIISRYNSWRQQKYPARGKLRESRKGETFERYSPVWILAGDFNFTEESEEYERIKRMNFIDTVLPERKVTPWGKGTKAKGVGKDPTLTLDYIFAGPQYISLDPLIKEKGLGNNRIIHDHLLNDNPANSLRVSDHYPVFATISLLLPEPG